MRYYPIFVNLENRVVIVVGGGPVAERKTISLIETGANVVIISPDLTETLKELVNARQIHHLCRLYHAGDLKGAALVIAATDSVETNRQIVQEAESRALFANNVSSSDHSTFIVPSVIAKKDLQIAISTGGVSPALAQRLRKELEQQFGPEWEEWVAKLGRTRDELRSIPMPPEQRKRLLHEYASLDPKPH